MPLLASSICPAVGLGSCGAAADWLLVNTRSAKNVQQCQSADSAQIQVCEEMGEKTINTCGHAQMGEKTINTCGHALTCEVAGGNATDVWVRTGYPATMLPFCACAADEAPPGAVA